MQRVGLEVRADGPPNSSIAAACMVVGILGIGIPLARMDTEPVRAALRSSEQW